MEEGTQEILWDVDPSAKQIFSSDDLKKSTPTKSEQEEEDIINKINQKKNHNIITETLDPKKSLEIFKNSDFQTQIVKGENIKKQKLSSRMLSNQTEFSYNQETKIETPLQKLSRLQYEINSLIQEISESEENENEILKSKDEISKKTSRDLVNELIILKSELNKLSENKKILDPVKYNLEQFKKRQLGFSNILEDETKKITSSLEEKPNNAATFNIPEKNENTNFFPSLEKRISRLENMVGSRDSTSLPLYKSIYQLKEQLNLLSEGQLKILEEKIKRITLLYPNEIEENKDLNSETENNQNELSKTEDLKNSKKISEIFDIMMKWDSTSQHLPILVTRLKNLKTLHEEAATFSQNLRNLQATQSNIKLQLENQKNLGNEIKDLMQKNMEQTNQNVKGLEERIEKLVNKN